MVFFNEDRSKNCCLLGQMTIKYGRNLGHTDGRTMPPKPLYNSPELHGFVTDHNLNVCAVCTKHAGEYDSVMLLQDSFEIYRRRNPVFGVTIHVRLAER